MEIFGIIFLALSGMGYLVTHSVFSLVKRISFFSLALIGLVYFFSPEIAADLKKKAEEKIKQKINSL